MEYSTEYETQKNVIFHNIEKILLQLEFAFSGIRNASQYRIFHFFHTTFCFMKYCIFQFLGICNIQKK